MDIFGISIKPLKKDTFLEKITDFKGQKIVFTPNPEILLKAKDDTEFQDILKQADFLTSDGIGLFIAYQILDSKLPLFLNILALPYYFFNLFFRRKYLYQKYGDRICGSDMTKYLLDFARENQKKIAVIDLYSLTDERKISSQITFVQKIQQKYPGLSIEIFVWNAEKKDQIIQKIRLFSPDFLFSTLGMKKQEKSIIEVMEIIPSISFGAGIGSSFDTITGFQPSVPKFWKQAGFEWLYRLICGKNRINRLKRLWRAIFVFVFEVYREKGRKEKR